MRKGAQRHRAEERRTGRRMQLVDAKTAHHNAMEDIRRWMSNRAATVAIVVVVIDLYKTDP